MDRMEPMDRNGPKLTVMDCNAQNWMEWTKVDRIEPSGSKLNVIGRSGPKRTELDRNARLI